MAPETSIIKVKCPICGKISDWKANPYRPFCGSQCKTRDLGDWATERYRIPGAEIESGSPEEEEAKKEQKKKEND